MVRSFLNGRFENTAFCVLAPDGKKRLSYTGRGPAQAFGDGRRGRGGGGGGGGGGRTIDDMVISGLHSIASDYPEKTPPGAVVQDFHSFRQALNVAAGDQRPLVVVSGFETTRNAVRKTLQGIMDQPDLVGRFHVDFTDAATDRDWHAEIDGTDGRDAITVVHPDGFGMAGKTLATLAADTPAKKLHAALLAANKAYSASETRKVYFEHVTAGRRNNVYFEGNVEYGEDRDGDGVIDHRPPTSRRR